MDEIAISSRDSDSQAFQYMVATYNGPAYARRARAVHAAFEHLLARCRKQRDEWLTFVRISLGMLHALAGSWDAVRPLVRDDESLDLLRRMHDELRPVLRITVDPTTSRRALRGTLAELIEGLERFNRRWNEYVVTVDLAGVNELREGYNRWYVLEKECALRNVATARAGFERLPPLTTADVLRHLPPFGVPRPA
jgi:hypothetical protein